MKTDEYRIPEKDGDVFIFPPPDQIEKEILSNRKKIEKWNFSVEGIPVALFRKNTKKECALLSREYSNDIGIPFKPSFFSHEQDEEPYMILTGHQPGFPHPGIIVKYLLLDQLIQKTAYHGMNIAVDSDAMSGISTEIPSIKPESASSHTYLQKFTKALPLELVSAPNKHTWETFLDTIERSLNDPIFKAVKIQFHGWRKELSSLKHNKYKKMSDLLVAAQKNFLEQNAFTQHNELPLSLLSGSESFLSFFLHIAKNSDVFAKEYNRQLGEYRKRHKLRYKANPFPDLTITENKIELPFWVIEGNTRKEVWVEKIKGEIILSLDTRELGRVPSNIDSKTDIQKLLPYPIRPKAITLSLFARMFASDIFIHGVGGTKYDEVTDGIIRDFFQVDPPAYITATLTKFPEVDLVDLSGEITEKEQLIRDMKYNPDRYAGDEHAKTITKKRELLLEIQKKDADKKNIGIKIKKINQELLHSVTPYVETLENDMLSIKKEQAIYEAVCRRDLPYFFFSAKQLTQHLLPR